MLLPQSSAFVSLRNRLNAVNSAGFLHIAPKSLAISLCHLENNISQLAHRSVGPLSTRSKLGREEIKWQELLLHFRSVQAKHEKARRQALGADTTPFSGFSATTEKPTDTGGSRSTTVGRPAMRRRVTGGEVPPPPPSILPPRNVLSPLNPRARGQSGLLPSALNPQSPPPTQVLTQSSKQSRVLSVNRKS